MNVTFFQLYKSARWDIFVLFYSGFLYLNEISFQENRNKYRYQAGIHTHTYEWMTVCIWVLLCKSLLEVLYSTYSSIGNIFAAISSCLVCTFVISFDAPPLFGASDECQVFQRNQRSTTHLLGIFICHFPVYKMGR